MKSNHFKLLGPGSGALVGCVLAALSITLTTQYALAAPRCAYYFSDKANRILIPAGDLTKQLSENYNSWNIKALQQIEKLKSQVPSLETTAQGKRLLNGLNEVLKDERLSSFHKLIQKAAARAQKDARAQDSSVNGSELLLASLKEEVSSFLGKEIANVRMADLAGRSRFSKEDMLRALGEVSIAEARTNLIGERGIHNISPDSVIGRYLSGAADMGRAAQTFVGQFFTGPNSRSRGTERLFVSVDRQTAPLIEKLINSNPHFLVHNHTPGQGTLHLQHDGKDISYAQYGSNMAIGGAGDYVGTLAPIIFLSSVEASNAMNYFELGRMTNHARTKYPWSLVDMSDGNSNLYMRPSAYSCCSHWFGEMPLGENVVGEYSVPGKRDQWGRIRDPLAQSQRDLRTAPVGTYTHFSQNGGNTPIGNQTRVDRLTRLVWQQGEGSEQMWSLLNAQTQLSRAELTNPGWILYTLISTGDANRVPVVLVYRENASEPLNQAILDGLRTIQNIPNY